MKRHRSVVVGLSLGVLVAVWALALTRASSAQVASPTSVEPIVADNARRMLEEGRRVFRYETFGDEAYWGDTLKLHRAIAGAKLGGRLGRSDVSCTIVCAIFSMMLRFDEGRILVIP